MTKKVSAEIILRPALPPHKPDQEKKEATKEADSKEAKAKKEASDRAALIKAEMAAKEKPKNVDPGIDTNKMTRLKSRIDTVGKEKMAYVARYNSAIRNLTVYKSQNQIVIKFDIDKDDADGIPAIAWCFPMLVRIADKDGVHLTHFVTAEQFTAKNDVCQILMTFANGTLAKN